MNEVGSGKKSSKVWLQLFGKRKKNQLSIACHGGEDSTALLLAVNLNSLQEIFFFQKRA
jgi:hypothetical protein